MNRNNYLMNINKEISDYLYEKGSANTSQIARLFFESKSISETYDQLYFLSNMFDEFGMIKIDGYNKGNTIWRTYR